MEVDVICPCHFIDWTFFTTNLKSWLTELPLKRLLIGCNNEETFKTLESYLKGLNDPRVNLLNQCEFKTLGMQIADLMKSVETEWFVYCHADAQLTKHIWKVLEAEITEKAGIIESERVQYEYNRTDKPTVYAGYHYFDRGFSGVQLIREKAIHDIVKKIEDDYVYRNEDIIFPNACTNAGYEYIKSFALHIHTCSQVNLRWTPMGKDLGEKENRLLTYDMQSKGIVKYCTPDEITVKAFRDGYGILIKEANANIFDFINGFVKETNPVWVQALYNMINDLLRGLYK